MNISRFTYWLGMVFIAIGILGFVPGLRVMPHSVDPALSINASYGRLFGLFPVNALHNIIHIALGALALMFYKVPSRARKFCKFNAIFYGVLTILGMFPNFNTLFGLVPIFGHDVWLHGIITAATAYYGFVPVHKQQGLAPRTH